MILLPMTDQGCCIRIGARRTVAALFAYAPSVHGYVAGAPAGHRAGRERTLCESMGCRNRDGAARRG